MSLYRCRETHVSSLSSQIRRVRKKREGEGGEDGEVGGTVGGTNRPISVGDILGDSTEM